MLFFLLTTYFFLADAVTDLVLSVALVVVFHCSITLFDVLLVAALLLLRHQICQVPFARHQGDSKNTIL